MMESKSKQVLIALNSLKTTEDGRIIIKWFDDSMTVITDSLIMASGEAETRQAQGAARLLCEILDSINNASDAIRSIRNREDT